MTATRIDELRLGLELDAIVVADFILHGRSHDIEDYLDVVGHQQRLTKLRDLETGRRAALPRSPAGP